MPLPAIFAAIAPILILVLQWLIVQLILWLVVNRTSLDLINELVEKISEFIKETNNHILYDIFKIEDLLFSVLHRIFMVVDSLIAKLESKMIAVIEVFDPEKIGIVIATINLAAMISEAIENAVSRITAPLFETFYTIRTAIDAVDSKLQAVQDTINRALQDFVHEVERLVYGKMMAIFDAFNDVVEFMRNFIEDIRACVINGQSRISQYNMDVDGCKAAAISFLISNIYSGRVLSDTDARNIINGMEAHLANIYPFDPSVFDVDWTAYTRPIPQLENYILKIEPPEILINPLVMPIFADIYAVVYDLEAKFGMLPTAIREALVGELEDDLRGILIIAIQNLLNEKKDEITDYFEEIRFEFEVEREENKRAITEKSIQIREEVEAFELKQVEKLPKILRPALEKAVYKIRDKIAERQNKVLVNIDEFSVDTSEVEHIITSFQKYQGGDQPNKEHALLFKIQDICR